MAQKLQYQNHASNPAAQPFNVGARHNLTKKNSWWRLGNTNNKKKRQDQE